MASASARGAASVKVDARATVRRARRLKRAMMDVEGGFLERNIIEVDWSDCLSC